MGSVDIEDATCRRISKTSSMKVVSVGYRLPPKYKYTAGLNDCLQATMWTLEHFLVPSVVLMGDSGDTNLVFGVAMRLIDADKVKVLALVPFTVPPDTAPEDKKAPFTAYSESANYTVNTLAAIKSFVESYDPPRQLFLGAPLSRRKGFEKGLYR